MAYMALAVLFGIPIYYLAISKGRSGFGYAISAMALGSSQVWLGPFGLLLPAAVLGCLQLLPPRPGAPGKAYMKVEFACPECGKTVTFPREREGAAELCPECGEILRVPKDGATHQPKGRNRPKPSATKGQVCFDSFGRPEPAHLLAAILNDNGVPARVESDSAGGALPHLGNASGHRIFIDASQWDEAVEIEEQIVPRTAGE